MNAALATFSFNSHYYSLHYSLLALSWRSKSKGKEVKAAKENKRKLRFDILC